MYTKYDDSPPGSPPYLLAVYPKPAEILETLEIFRRKKTKRDSFLEGVCETKEEKRMPRLTKKTLTKTISSGRRAKLGDCLWMPFLLRMHKKV